MELEDFCEDIIKKAQVGLRISNTDLCNQAGINEESLVQVKQGNFNTDVVKKIAPILNLKSDALIVSGEKSWLPKDIKINGLNRYVTNYKNFKVNAYLIWNPSTLEGVIADTGITAHEMIEDIKKMGIEPRMLLLTHSHTDHINDVESIQKTFPKIKIVIHNSEMIPNAEGIEEGTTFEIKGLKITTRKTSGHSPGGLTYLITGLEKPIAVVGDALFAGSIGGVSFGYKEAIENIKNQILSLPNETILCPGHGPMTTVGEEKEHNPFF